MTAPPVGAGASNREEQAFERLSGRFFVRFDPVPHRYTVSLGLDGPRATWSSVTEIVDGCGLRPGYEGVPETVLARAAARGVRVHRVAARLAALADPGLYPWEEVDHEIAPYVTAYAHYLEHAPFVVVDSERLVLSEAGRYVGRLDLVGIDKCSGQVWVVDVKTRRPVTGDGEQLAAYAAALAEDEGGRSPEEWLRNAPGVRLGTLWLDPKRGAKLVPYSLAGHLSIFRAATVVWSARLSRGLA